MRTKAVTFEINYGHVFSQFCLKDVQFLDSCSTLEQLTSLLILQNFTLNRLIIYMFDSLFDSE